MSFPFDASSKFFISLGLRDWLTLIGRPTNAEVVELDTDLSTVSTAADKVIRVNDADPSIEHIEVQANHDGDLPIRVCRYGILLLYENRIPINSTVVLLRPAADGPELTGLYEARAKDGSLYLQYRYHVIRLWEIPANSLLNAGIGVLPLAPLGKLELDELPEILREVRVRMERQLPPSSWDDYWAGLGVLMGLKYETKLIRTLLEGVLTMIKMSDLRDSSLVQFFGNEFREEGREEGAAIGEIRGIRKAVLSLVAHRFGSIDPALESFVNSTSNLAELEKLLLLASDVDRPDQLLSKKASDV